MNDWTALAQRLTAQWRGNDYDALPYHHGLFEGRAEAAQVVAAAPPEEREAALFEFLASTLMGDDWRAAAGLAAREPNS